MVWSSFHPSLYSANYCKWKKESVPVAMPFTFRGWGEGKIKVQGVLATKTFVQIHLIYPWIRSSKPCALIRGKYDTTQCDTIQYDTIQYNILYYPLREIFLMLTAFKKCHSTKHFPLVKCLSFSWISTAERLDSGQTHVWKSEPKFCSSKHWVPKSWAAFSKVLHNIKKYWMHDCTVRHNTVCSLKNLIYLCLQFNNLTRK